MSAPLSQRIGIVGGMGNEAMVDLLQKMADFQQDQRLPFVAFGNSRLAYKPEEATRTWLDTEIPERRKYDTTYTTLCLMQYLGVNNLGLACNSGHKHFRKMLPDVQVDFVDMLKQTARALEGTEDTVLILGVDSLVNSNLYQKALEEQGVNSTKSSPENQHKVMEAIYDPAFGIKTAKITEQAERLLCEVITEESQVQGCSKIILGCTELPLAITPQSCERFRQQGMMPKHIEVIDASRVLAESLSSLFGEQHELSLLNVNHYIRQYTDWHRPTAFKVSSLESAARIQQDIFKHTSEFLEKQGKSITGSYFHLPTLFYSDSEKDIETKLAEIGVAVHGENEHLNGFIKEDLAEYFLGMKL